MRDSAATLSPNDEISVDDFRRSVEVAATTSDYPYAIAITSNIPLYDGRVVSRAHCKEWTRVLSDGPGAFVVKHTWKDLSSIDAATEIFNEIIASERAAGVGVGDHFAAAGANDRVWNSLQKLCLRAPEVYVRYMANPVIDLACRSWLGPGYQLATQINQVRPGGKAQQAHRDYHLGFMSPAQMAEYPAHIHKFGPMLILQGGIAHCDMPVESGTTKLLPYSQRYLQGYVAATRPDFREYFEDHYVQLPLEKGDLLFFSPALFHAGGENRSTNISRMVNLIQVASPFAKHMEQLDRTAMSRAIFPHLSKLQPKDRAAVIAATADGYPFPTNLDLDPPIGGLAPPSHQDLLAKAVEESWDQQRLDEALTEQAKRRLA
jgi:ectoine hydroxylase-related dioxygenase (phytanoyl-CoA dioxygenase family)